MPSLKIPGGAGGFRAAAPAADADHFVEGGPIGEGVVCAVNDYKAAAVFDELIELLAEIGGPVWTVVIHDDDFVFGEVWMEIGEVFIGAGRGGDGDLENSGVVEFLFQDAGGELPVVIGAGGLAVDEEDGDGSGEGWGEEEGGGED